MDLIEKIRQQWLAETIKQPVCTKEELYSFELKNNVMLPNDLKIYFQSLNGTGENYDDNFFQFYSLNQFQKISEEYQDWQGIPNYGNISNTLINCENYFVFANYNCHLFAYAIFINNDSESNGIIVICGDEFKKIASSFSEFLNLYLNNSIELFFNT